MVTPPIAVQRLGQSIWTDNISRNWIENGTLQQLIDEQGVLGLTSNPSIFQQAIGESSEYDDEITAHLDEDRNVLYERLIIRDVRDAADLLKPVYDRTGGLDGYVSMEASPMLAHDTEKTIAEVQRLFEAVGRPNVMIQIPATEAGLPAIEACIAAGVNINVTLVFSISNYEAVAEAYIRGLERRLEAGQDVSNVASVASFFVSRIDATIDKMLENNIRAAQGRDLDRVAANNALLGKAGIANAKLAYQSYRRLFESNRFDELYEAGAMVQRLLWASTGTKNPAYPDTYYVDALIGRQTVSTLPPHTLEAFIKNGTAEETLTYGLEAAREVMAGLKEVGITFDQIMRQLQDDGVELFVDSYEMLMDQVQAKRSVLKTGVIQRQKLALGIYREKVERALQRMEKDFVNGRIWGRDATVWKDHPAVMATISERLGWLDVKQTIDRERLKQLQASIKQSDFQHVLLMGTGGSSLAPEVLFRTFGQQPGFPDLHVLDSTDPAEIQRVEDALNLDKTLFVVSSKSGTTTETLAFYRYFWTEERQQFIAITDAGTPLHDLAQQNGFRDIFLNPANIGGRYAALSYVGMVPAALIGLDLDRLWRYADNMIEACGDLIPAHSHPGLWLGAIMGALAKERRDKLMIFASQGIDSFGEWTEQLIAESTGKQNRGILPVAGAAVGKPHDYGSDRVFIYLKLEGDPSNAALDEGIRALREAGHPRVTFTLPDRYALAGEFFRWEYATVVASHMLDINPFDEPNVSEAKQNTNELLASFTEHGTLPTTEPTLHEGDIELYINQAALGPLQELCEAHGFDNRSLTDLVAAQIVGTNAGDYFALLAYAPRTPEVMVQLEEIRRRIRHMTRRAVTTSFGPRYLHSIGQLHKGGAGNGVFFQLTYTNPKDIDIPGTAYSFGVLNAAQAAGDMKALYDHKRRGLRLHTTQHTIQPTLDVLLAAIEIVEKRRQ